MLIENAVWRQVSPPENQVCTRWTVDRRLRSDPDRRLQRRMNVVDRYDRSDEGSELRRCRCDSLGDCARVSPGISDRPNHGSVRHKECEPTKIRIDATRSGESLESSTATEKFWDPLCIRLPRKQTTSTPRSVGKFLLDAAIAHSPISPAGGSCHRDSHRHPDGERRASAEERHTGCQEDRAAGNEWQRSGTEHYCSRLLHSDSYSMNDSSA
jgi:hypothetical protein